MKAYITYIDDQNNDEVFFVDASDNKAEAIQKFKTEHLAKFLEHPECDIYFMLLVEVELSQSDFNVVAGVDEDCYFDNEDYCDFVREIREDQTAVNILETAADQAGMQLHQYWMDNQTKYPNIPDDIAEPDDYYFDFQQNMLDEYEQEYFQLIQDFIKSGKFVATV